MRLDYEGLKALAAELRRPIKSLLAMGLDNDPFYAGMPSRRTRAEWFLEIWETFEFNSGVHLRRIHYILISADPPVAGHTTARYLNTHNCWHDLIGAARDARLLGLVPFGAFEDQRVSAPKEYLFNEAADARLSLEEPTPATPPSWFRIGVYLSEPPKFHFEPAKIDQRYHIEIFSEKSTADDVVHPLALAYRLNYVSGAGHISLTHCHRLLERGRASGRPVRVLFLSDFDKTGWTMAPAMARTCEFLIRNHGFEDIDFRLRHVLLTPDQIRQHQLPPTPMKDTVRGKDKFLEWAKEVHGVDGATELDALEALRPGVLHQILRDAIRNYHDGDLGDEVERVADEFREDVDRIYQEIIGRHEDELEAIRKHQRELASRCNAELEPIIKKYMPGFRKIAKRYNKLQQKMQEELVAEAPDVSEIEWPQPEGADEDLIDAEFGDVLYASDRGYLDQIGFYRKHDGK